MMKTLVLSGAGYGSRLQAHYMQRFIRPIKVSARDTDGGALFVPGVYKFKFDPVMDVGSLDDWEMVIPSYNMNEFGELFNQMIPKTSKASLRDHIPAPYHIPYMGEWNDEALNGPFIIHKPLFGSGSKGVSLVKNSGRPAFKIMEYVLQEYVPGPELIIDGVITKGDILYTYRHSLDRINGFDTMVAFDSHPQTDSQVREILNSLSVTYMGPFNIQCRLHEGKRWKAMEIDFRLSGNSIINIGYDDLITAYIDLVGGKPKWGAYPSRGLVRVGRGYNDKAIAIYQGLDLLPPYNYWV